MKPRSRYVYLLSAALIFSLLLFLFTGCGISEDDPQNDRICGDRNAYTELLMERLPGYQLETPGSTVFRGLNTGENLCACLQVQAEDMHGRNSLPFTPHCLVTVVFAVDRDLTELRPDSWQTLMDSGLSVSYPVGVAETRVTRRTVLAALAYGLEGPDYGKKAALSYLETLHHQGRLENAEKICPVTLCLDMDAIRMQQEGRNLEIIVPRDGTLSFAYGVLGNAEQPPISRQALLDAGLRLTDGTCENPAYPDDYTPAVTVSDFSRFHRVTENTTRDIRRMVFHTRYFNSADGRENILILTGATLLILVWTVTALHRSISRRMRHWILCISGQTVLWLLLSCFKYMLEESSLLNRLCWYAYYIFLMGLPLALLYMAAVIDRPPNCRHLPAWFWFFGVSYPILLTLVATNDLHQLVFRLEIETVWTGGYSYMPGYYLILAQTVVCFLLAVGILIYKSRKSPRKYAWVGPVLIAVLLIGFNIGYLLGIPVCRDGNLTLVFCIVSVLFTEALLRSGLLPINVGYKHFFSFSPINMQLLNTDGNTVLSSAGAEELTQPQRAAMLAAPGTPLACGPDSLLHSCPIHGGIAVWQEDIRTIRMLQQQLQESIRRIEKANALLQKQREVRSQKIRAEVVNDLFNRLEADIEDQVQELSQMIDSLPQSPQRKQQLSCITLLLCHIKRRCNLFFLAQEGETMSSNELAVYIDELSEFASYADVHTLVRCGISGPMEVNAVTLFYDFYFFLLRWATQNHDTTLIGRIESGEDSLSFSVLSSQGVGQARFSVYFTQSLQQAGAGISFRKVEEQNILTLTVPRKGGRP